ncbi:hypothetical protein [Rhodoferax sp.]|uniref:hypothetical protein n=1 Tax=Rhodoferax sp. TaxID=50421 RepID=UPI00374DAB03
MLKKPFLFLALSAALVGAYAASDAPPSGGPGKNPELDAALQACAASVAKGTDGRPDRTAMDACMTAKGFTKPSGPPGGKPPSN